MIPIAKSLEICRFPIARILALLCCFASLAVSNDQHNAQRTPFTLLAAIAIPVPEPQTSIPKLDLFLDTVFANFFA